MTYEELLIKADKDGLRVKEKPIQGNDGRIKGRRIAIRKDIGTTKEKSCVLAEELGHHHTSTGNILDQADIMNRKQEYRARLYGYNLKIGLQGLVRAYEAGCRDLYEIAEMLDVTEEYLKDAIDCYHSKYGQCTAMDNYVICFEPVFGVMRMECAFIW